MSSGFTLYYHQPVARAVYLLGGYIGYSVIAATHSFFYGSIAGALSTARGPSPRAGGHTVYPNGWLFYLGVSVTIAIGLYYLLRRTGWGRDHEAWGGRTARWWGRSASTCALVFALVFRRSALSWPVSPSARTVSACTPSRDSDILLFALAVVIVGGLGS